jgi:predicted DCC family thiol-disulfide oxidoreductase YuxK
MQRYLLFDARCSVCRQIAQSIEGAAAGKLEALSLHDTKAKALLDRAFPEGWDFAPYLVTTDQQEIRAWTGVQAALRLGWLMGPIKAIRVWRLARRSRAILPTRVTMHPTSLSRRSLLKSGAIAAVTAAIGTLVSPGSVAYACIPCETCGMNCVLVAVCRRLYACGAPQDPDACDKYNCYDQYSGEICDTFYDCCCDCVCA